MDVPPPRVVFVQCPESGEEHLQELYDLQPDGSGRMAWAAVEEAFGAKVELESTGIPGLLQEGFYKGCTLSTFAAGLYVPVVVHKARACETYDGLDDHGLALALLQPEFKNVPPLKHLAAELLKAPNAKLPVSPRFYQLLPMSLRASASPSEGLLASWLSSHLEMPLLPDNPERRTYFVVWSNFLQYIERLQALVPFTSRLPGMETRYNKSESSSVAISSGIAEEEQPEFTIIAGKLSFVFAEVKSASAGLEAAWEAHRLNFEGGLPSHIYGSNQYVICMAAAGSEVQFGHVNTAGQVTRFEWIVDTNRLQDRFHLACIAFNLYGLMRAMLKAAPPSDRRITIPDRIEREHNTTVWVTARRVTKRILRSQEFFKKINTSFEVVKAAHAVSQICPTLVSNSSITNEETRKRDHEGNLVCIYTVVLTRVGYRIPFTCLPLYLLVPTVLSVLRALAALHSRGLMHCDVTEDNILYDHDPFLNDLEMAHTCPWDVNAELAETIWRGDSPLNDAGQYDYFSDLYQLAKLMKKKLKAGWQRA